MKNNRMAQQLRALSMKPSMESDGEGGNGSDVTTGDGDQTMKVTVEAPQDTPADGAGAPGEDKDLSTKIVTVDEGPKEESAETTSATDGESVIVSQEGDGVDGAGSDVTTGDGEQVIKTSVEPAQDVQADGAGAPGEDANVTAKVVEVGERSELESAETQSIDSADVQVSQESLIAIAAISGLIALASGLSANKAGKLKNEYIEIAKKVKVKRAQLDHLITAAETEARLELKKAKVSTESVSKDIENLEKGKIGTAERRTLAGLQGLVGGAAFAIGSPVLAAINLGISGAVLLNNVMMVRKVKRELMDLEAKLSDKEFEIIQLASEAEKNGAKVSQEAIDEMVGEINTAANAAVAAAAAVAEGAAAAAEAAAAAVDAATDTPAEVVANAQDAAGEATDAADDMMDDSGHEEMEELEEAIEAGESHAANYENETATLESLIDALKDAQHTGGLTPQSARFFQISFESMGTRLTGAPFRNAHGENAMPSLESFGGTGRRIDATRVSMEAVKDVLNKILEVLKATWAQIKEWMKKFFEAAFSEAARLKQRADKIIEAGKKAQGQAKSGQIKIGGLAQKIAIGTTVGADNIAALETIVQEAATRGSAGAAGIAKIRDNLAKVAQSASFSDLASAFNTAENSNDLRSAAFKTPMEYDGKQGFATDVLPGNFKLFTYHPGKNPSEGTVQGFVAAYQLLHGYPVQKIEGETKPGEDVSVPTLSPAQIVALAQRAKKIIEAFENAKKDIEAEAVDLGNLQFNSELQEDQVSQLKAMVSQISRAVRSSSNSQAKLAKVVVTGAGAFLDLAAISLKQYGTAEVAEPAANSAATA